MRIANRPQRLGRQDYTAETERFTSLVSPLPGVVAIATVGSVGTLGYSDLDYLVVINEDFEPRNSEKLLHRHAERDRRIVLHGPIVCKIEDYAELFDHLSLDEPVLHSGRLPPRSTTNPSNQDSLIERLANLIDFSEARISQAAATSKSATIDQRHAMTALWSTTHSFRIAQEAGLGLSDEAEMFVSHLRADRERWSNGGSIDDQEFLKLIETNLSVHEEILVKALRATAPDALNNKPSDVVVSFTAGSKTIECSTSRHTLDAFAKVAQFRGRAVPWSTLVRAPIGLAAHLSAYGFEQSLDSRRKRRPLDWASSERYIAVMRRRFEFAKRYYGQLADLGLLSANGPYIILPVSTADWPRRIAAAGHKVAGFGRMH